MKIIRFDEKYAKEMAELYAREYSEGNGREWTVEKAKQSIEVAYKYFPDYCFMVLNGAGECMGAIFNLVNPYFSGDILFIISIQVKPDYRKEGVGKIESLRLRVSCTAILVLGLLGLCGPSVLTTEMQVKKLKDEGFDAKPAFAVTSDGIFLGAVGNMPDEEKKEWIGGRDAAWLQDVTWSSSFPQSVYIEVSGVKCGVADFNVAYQTGTKKWKGVGARAIGAGCTW